MDEGLLSENNLRKTKKRQAIIRILADSDIRLTAEEIFKACSASSPLNLSTVYRTLTALTEKGIVIKTAEPDGRACFSLACTTEDLHHHHLVCAKCRSSIDLGNCPMDEMNKKISSETGFVITGHSIELTGLCPKCQ